MLCNDARQGTGFNLLRTVHSVQHIRPVVALHCTFACFCRITPTVTISAYNNHVHCTCHAVHDSESLGTECKQCTTVLMWTA
jgi:hypothetical protein